MDDLRQRQRHPPAGGIGGLTNGTVYFFRVGAHNSAGWGQYSSAIGAVPRTVPSAPGLTANPVNATQVNLTVQRPANGGAPIDLYRVEMKTGVGGPWVLWHSLGANNLASFIDYVNNLSPGTMYYFRVGAHNAAGWGPYSAEISAKTSSTTPGAPTGCTAYQTSYNTMYIDWNPASDGGSPIINYNVMIEKGQWKYWVVSSDWNHVEGYWYWETISTVGHDTVASITARAAVVSHGSYKIFIRARNSMGWGPVCETYVDIV